MLVQVKDAVAVSPNNRFGEIWTVGDRGTNATGINSRGGITISENGAANTPGDFNPERIQIDDSLFAGNSPSVNKGDNLGDITGVISYSFGNFELLPKVVPTVTSGNLSAEITSLTANPQQLTIASYNVLNLDPNDNDGDRDLADGQFTRIATQIVNNLQSPDIIALQEIQDNSGSVDDTIVDASVTYQTLIDAIIAAGGPDYSFADIAPQNNQDGGQPGGNIRVGYLYKSDRVSLALDSLTLIGQGNPNFDNSRKSLVAKFQFNGEEITLINNHFSSKGGSSPLFGSIQPSINNNVQKREGQAQAVNDYIDSNPNAKVVVLGDLNEFQFFSPLDILKGGSNPVLVNLTETLVPQERYSYIFQGNSQSLDHILVSKNLADFTEFDPVHVNAEFSNQASDHDPLVARIDFSSNPAPVDFTLQLLHAADQEAGIPALLDAPRFSAVLNALKNQDANQDGLLDYPNTLVLSSGDAYIPGSFLEAAADPSLSPLLGKAGRGRADIAIQNELGFEAIAFGNHEFDFGTGFIADAIAPDGLYTGAQFPYLSSNLDFSTDANLSGLITADGQRARDIGGKIAKSAIVTTVDGERIGLIGATTPALGEISNSGGVCIAPPNPNDIDALAAEIQKSVDALLAANGDINKVILLAHMQQISIEQQLAERLRNVDIIIAGGSNTLLADSTDLLRAGDTVQGPYPILINNPDNQPVAVVNTDGNYKYVGRLVVDFDRNGNIIPQSIDPNISGVYATDDRGVAAVNGTPDSEIVAITDALREVIQARDGNLFGLTTEFLNGIRSEVRTEETNLGNLSADANLAIAKKIDPQVVISIKNGGGIRDQIGRIETPPGTVGGSQRLPTAANPLTDKPEGGISQLDIENAFRFNNDLSLLTVTAAELLQVIEHGVAATAPGATPGQFPQISGLRFSFDPNLPVGNRVQSLAIVNENSKIIEVVAQNGNLVGDPNRTFRLVTLGFLAGGGDGYPFPSLSNTNRVDLIQPDNGTGAATFTDDGSEQDALAEYLAANFNLQAYSVPDTPAALDFRIQNLNFRSDTVLSPLIENFSLAPVADNQIIEVRGPAGVDIELQTNGVSSDAAFVNEVGIYPVVNQQGAVRNQNGDLILPGATGYLEAALSQGDVILSALPDLLSPTNVSLAPAKIDPTRSLLSSGSNLLGFYLVANNTTDAILNGDRAGNVFFSFRDANPDKLNHLQITQESSKFNFGWEDTVGGGDLDFNDVAFSLSVAETSSTLSQSVSKLQGRPERELLDFRQLGPEPIQVTFTVNKEAAFDNFVGFYIAADEQGSIDRDGDGNIDIRPGDKGYRAAALQQRIDVNLTGTGTFTTAIAAREILVPFIIANGTPNNVDGELASVYTPFISANADNTDRIRLLGTNIFGFEDLIGGGDGDYNDLVISVDFI